MWQYLNNPRYQPGVVDFVAASPPAGTGGEAYLALSEPPEPHYRFELSTRLFEHFDYFF